MKVAASGTDLPDARGVKGFFSLGPLLNGLLVPLRDRHLVHGTADVLEIAFDGVAVLAEDDDVFVIRSHRRTLPRPETLLATADLQLAPDDLGRGDKPQLFGNPN